MRRKFVANECNAIRMFFSNSDTGFKGSENELMQHWDTREVPIVFGSKVKSLKNPKRAEK